MATPETAPRDYCPTLRRRVRAAAGVLPRVRHATPDEPRRRRLPRHRVAAPPPVVSGRLDLARAPLPRAHDRRDRGSVAAGSTRTTPARRLVATNPQVTVGPGVTQPRFRRSRRRARSRPRRTPTITTGTAPPALPAPRRRAPSPTPAPNPNAPRRLARGKSGYTNVLESLPLAAGRANAVARARAAKRAGLPAVGVLALLEYSSLHPGLLRRLLRDLRLAGQASAGRLGRPGEGLPRRLPDSRHPLIRGVTRRRSGTRLRRPRRAAWRSLAGQH